MKTPILFIIITFFLSTYSHAKKCKVKEPTEKPTWVEQAYNYQKTDFVYGFAMVPFNKKKKIEDLVKQAANEARQELGKSLQVSLKSSIKNRMSKQTKAGKISVSEKVLINELATTEIKLPGVPVKAQWQNPKNCDVYVLVEASKELIDLMGVKTEIDYQLKQAGKSSLGFSNRVAVINKAISTLAGVELSKIPQSPSSEDYTFKFKQIKNTVLENAKTDYLNGQYSFASDSNIDNEQRLKIIEDTLALPFLTGNSQQARREKLRFLRLRKNIIEPGSVVVSEQNKQTSLTNEKDEKNLQSVSRSLEALKKSSSRSLNLD